MPELRQNIITGEWVVIAPERAKRPTDFIAAENVKHEKDNCPFCPGGNADKNKISGFGNKSCYSAPNGFPVFLEDESKVSVRSYRTEDKFYSARPSTGGHDLIIIKEHKHQIYDFSGQIWSDLFSAGQKRYKYWRQYKNAIYPMMIYNQGIRGGASIYHPHAQIFISNIIPNQVQTELSGAQNYFENNGSCVFCSLVIHEKSEKIRIIAENENFVAFTFYAARFPFEIWVLPKVHSAHFEDITKDLLNDLSKIMKDVTGKLGKILNRPPLNFYIHDLPNTFGPSDFYHWHLEITPRVTSYGGYELGSGIIVDVMSPEDAAEFLTEKAR